MESTMSLLFKCLMEVRSSMGDVDPPPLPCTALVSRHFAKRPSETSAGCLQHEPWQQRLLHFMQSARPAALAHHEIT
jgi:hypothetical protein